MGALEDDAAVMRAVRAEILRKLGEVRAYARPTPFRRRATRDLLRTLELMDEQIAELRRRLACL